MGDPAIGPFTEAIVLQPYSGNPAGRTATKKARAVRNANGCLSHGSSECGPAARVRLRRTSSL